MPIAEDDFQVYPVTRKVVIFAQRYQLCGVGLRCRFFDQCLQLGVNFDFEVLGRDSAAERTLNFSLEESSQAK